ncbi:neuronal acetylcholine receptor subunit alpha-6-like isoform X2 [Actinia tenebrosa]|uniref:Neuronal acetylcholine receptor subunit alpha-6-like isoform X2 n=1 Tax=Actinia tenebrosa TaxID=6105 RepID=A0A6P8H9S8_ACTTE|nr:neuronal acetylcholine receptor subunit alpha-6-like isoform X2 [Actinia tenebrosa]XP_031549253.1 neuronal acetylcholine receptor subunit alpha-6-like isoform X2 [Actinia tenebrosa]
MDDQVAVNIWCSLTYVGDIDVINQQFACEFWMTATWKAEPKLQGKKNEEVDWDQEWDPKITFTNATAIDRMQKGQRLYTSEEGGKEMTYAQEMYKVRGTFKGQVDLADFPLDFQELPIILSSDWTDRHVKFQKDMLKGDVIRHLGFSAPQEWSLCSHVHTDVTSIVLECPGASDRHYPMYIITAHVQRKIGYYIWNVVLFMFVITGLSFASFAVSPDHLADQLTVTLTILLTGVAFKFAVSKNLPSVSYATLLDKYVLIHLLFVCFIALLNTMSSAITPTSRASYNFACMAGGLGVFVLIQVVMVIVAAFKRRVAKRELMKFANLYKKRDDEIERMRRERDWYAERSKQPKTPTITLTPALRQFTFSANGVTKSPREREGSAPDSPKSYV